jgi:hypothetical protein
MYGNDGGDRVCGAPAASESRSKCKATWARKLAKWRWEMCCWLSVRFPMVVVGKGKNAYNAANV